MSISVLMSVYFKEKAEYFQQSMESIWDNQTLKPFEIILIEDGILTNELYDLIEKWKIKIGDKFKIIPLPRNQGLTKALNIGIEYCKGDFIARMDTDDISAPNRFEKQIDFFKKNSEVDVLGGSIQEFDDSVSKGFIRR